MYVLLATLTSALVIPVLSVADLCTSHVCSFYFFKFILLVGEISPQSFCSEAKQGM